MSRMTRQELKHDEMADLGEATADWFQRHGNTLLTVFIVVVGAWLGWKGYERYTLGQKQAATAEVSALLRQYNVAIRQDDAAQREEMLTKVISDAARIASERAGTFAGRTALLTEGNAHYYRALVGETTGTGVRESLTKARELYDKYIQQATDQQERAAGNLALAQTLENLYFSTKTDQLGVEASETYQEVIKLAPKSYLAAEALMGKGRLLQNQKGRQGEADRLYQDVIAERSHKDSATTGTQSGTSSPAPASLTPEQVSDIRNFHDLGQAARAKEMRAVLRGLPTAAVE